MKIEKHSDLHEETLNMIVDALVKRDFKEITSGDIDYKQYRVTSYTGAKMNMSGVDYKSYNIEYGEL